jgi:biotin synthase
MLSRVTWPAFQTERVVSKIASAWQKKTIQRVCIQAINYPKVFDHVLALTKEILTHASLPLSVSCQPLNLAQMKMLAEAGVERVSIALDASTEELFTKVKGASSSGPYNWQRQRKTLEEAVQVFGRGRVSTHLIVGLGETERQLIETFQWCADSGVHPSLFAFTPVSGTALEELPQPSVASYRRVQLARHLIVHGKIRFENMKFDDDGQIIDLGVSSHLLKNVIENGTAFQTSGCPGCNRPYYNERPGGTMYNYPRQLLPHEVMEIKRQLEKEV